MLLRNSNETRNWLEYINATRFNNTFMEQVIGRHGGDRSVHASDMQDLVVQEQEAFAAETQTRLAESS